MLLELVELNDNVFKWGSCYISTSKENVGGQMAKHVPNFCFNNDKCPFYLLTGWLFIPFSCLTSC
jgi:hypothetical protein